METYWIVIAAGVALLIGLALGYLLADGRRRAGETAAQVALTEATCDADALRGTLEQAKAEQCALEVEVAQLRANLEELRVANVGLSAEIKAAQTLNEQTKTVAEQRIEETKAATEQQIRQIQAVADQRIIETKAATEQRIAETLASTRKQIEDMTADREVMQHTFKALSEASIEEQTKKAEQAAVERAKRTEEVLAPVKDNLNLLQQELGKVQQQRAALDAELKEQVRAVQATGQRLGEQTNALATALRKPQTRGAWGEAQLQNVVEAAGMKEHVDFTTQFSSTNDDGQDVRPDMRVKLGEGRFVFVDSKVPMEAFLDALEIDDETLRREALSRVSKHVKTHVDQLSAKNYFTSDGGTPEFVVLFIPHEAMAAEALYNDPTLYEYSFAKNVVIATPTTLLAMLKAIRYSWQQNDLAENASKIAEVATQLYKRTGDLAGHFEALGKNIDKVVSSFNKTVGSFEGSFTPAARRMHALGVKGDVLKVPAEVRTAVREPKPPQVIPGHAARAELSSGTNADDLFTESTDADYLGVEDGDSQDAQDTDSPDLAPEASGQDRLEEE